MSPNLKVKYVSYGASTQGNWQIVDFGEDYKIELVQAGEDFSVQVVDFGQGCNQDEEQIINKTMKDN